MRRYETEIVIPPDRYVALQLPAHLPEGRAIVTVRFDDPESVESAAWPEGDLDRQDIEWWDEFEDPEFDDPRGLPARSSLH